MVTLSSKGLELPLYLAPSGSTSHWQPLDLVNEETSQAAPLYDAPVLFQRPSGSDCGALESPTRLEIIILTFACSFLDHTGDPLDMWDVMWFSQDSSSPNPQLRSTPPPGSTLTSDPLPQDISSANSPISEPTFNVDPPFAKRLGMYPIYAGFKKGLMLSLVDTYIPEKSQLLVPKGTNSRYRMGEAVSPNSSPITPSDCVCDEGFWLQQCPQLWNHYRSAFAATSAVCGCTEGTHSHMVSRNCSAAAIHLMTMVGCPLRSSLRSIVA